MTDSDIVKALECCISDKHCRKIKCPFYENGCENDIYTLEKYALDLINRLQADVENYKQIAENQQKIILDKAFENKRLRTSNDALRMANELCKGWEERAKAEAYKEFAELVHCHCESIINHEWNKKVSPVSWADAYEQFDEEVDNLSKELVGDSNE